MNNKRYWRGRLAVYVTSIFTVLMAASEAPAADPRLDSWFTKYSGKYARLYETTADLNSGNSKTTWSRGSISQTLPAYSGVQEISYSDNWVYINTTGLGSHVMGPWYLNAAKTQIFPNLPANKKALYRIPRNPITPTTKTLTGLGAIGYFVDGVAMFDGRDAFYWNGTTEVGGGAGGGGLWNRDAYVNESVTFDPANAHQEQTGTYHYHANPIALRYLLDDHIAFDGKVYREEASALHHSPILGWVRDGFPIYGPYGYAKANDSKSGVRRMISGFVIRNGANGTFNLSATGRNTLPAWAARAQNRSATLITSEYGPAVSTQYPLGRYLEDNDYLGDLGKTQGTDFDLDEFNGRFCVTPEFPNGTYAYFVSIAPNGTPTFPYNIGRRFYGDPTGNTVQTITETVKTHFVGGPNTPVQLGAPSRNVSSGVVTLTWTSVEGGSYRVESSSDLAAWKTQSTDIASQGTVTTTSGAKIGGAEYYRVARTALANYDSLSSVNPGQATGNTTTEGEVAGAGAIVSIMPASTTRGSSVTVTVTLNSNAQPPLPPQNVSVRSITIGSIAGTAVSRPTQNTLRATFTFPNNAPIGPQPVTVTFPAPPGQTTNPTFSLDNGFVLN